MSRRAQNVLALLAQLPHLLRHILKAVDDGAGQGIDRNNAGEKDKIAGSAPGGIPRQRRPGACFKTHVPSPLATRAGGLTCRG